MTEIKKVAVIGSGVMGAGIAAHIANSGTPVILLDIVPDGAENRNVLAEGAIERLLKTNPAPLTHKRNAKLITPANIEDNLDMLADVDWVIEAVIERLDIKQSLYKKVDEHRKKGSIVSSNTSTIPLETLVGGFPDSFKQDFLVAHFFNPPRYMRLLELVGGKETRKDALETIDKFADINLGKGVVDCKDTPGFIANRIGIFWMMAALRKALEMNISVEDADAVMGRPIGVPNTAIFGLFDLIGIDLMPLIAKAFKDTLPEGDRFLDIYEEPELVTKMIADGYTGRKGKGGFYRMNKADGKKVKEAINFETGEYSPAKKSTLESVKASKGGLRALVTHDDIGGRYAWEVLRETLAYAASLIPEMSDDIKAVDDAMKMGYAWKFGPFELIDKLGCKDTSGPKWFAEALAKEGLKVPAILASAGENPFYIVEDGAYKYATLNGNYQEIPFNPESWMLSDIKVSSEPIEKNPSASLWDVGNGILCLEFTSKMNALDNLSLEMIQKTIEIVKDGYKGLIIGNDGGNFCVGANIGLMLFAANAAEWDTLKGLIKQGQDAYMALKHAPFPVVSAPAGMALGGGCEILLHSDAVQAHIETYTGLVEIGVGVVPGWGGCKEMVLRNISAVAKATAKASENGNMFSNLDPDYTTNVMPALEKAFMTIGTARVSKSAEDARDMLILNDKSRISMNRCRLLPDAKKLCLELAENYTAPEVPNVSLPGETARVAFDMAISSMEKSGKATPHDVVVCKVLANVLSGGDTDITEEISENDLLALEREAFDKLIRNPNSLARIEHMLNTGKPLRN